MTNWHRMEWQGKANRIAEVVKVACVAVFFPEMFLVLTNHFEIWFVMAATVIVGAVAQFVDHHTRMWRVN